MFNFIMKLVLDKMIYMIQEEGIEEDMMRKMKNKWKIRPEIIKIKDLLIL